MLVTRESIGRTVARERDAERHSARTQRGTGYSHWAYPWTAWTKLLGSGRKRRRTSRLQGGREWMIRECQTIRNVFMLGRGKDDEGKCHSLSVHLKKTTKKNKRGIYRKKNKTRRDKGGEREGGRKTKTSLEKSSSQREDDIVRRERERDLFLAIAWWGVSGHCRKRKSEKGSTIELNKKKPSKALLNDMHVKKIGEEENRWVERSAFSSSERRRDVNYSWESWQKSSFNSAQKEKHQRPRTAHCYRKHSFTSGSSSSAPAPPSFLSPSPPANSIEGKETDRAFFEMNHSSGK